MSDPSKTSKRPYVYTNVDGEYLFCRAASIAEATEYFHEKAKRASWPKCRCGTRGGVFQDHIGISDECDRCAAASHAGECAQLSHAESGGGSEMMNDLWASRTFDE